MATSVNLLCISSWPWPLKCASSQYLTFQQTELCEFRLKLHCITVVSIITMIVSPISELAKLSEYKLKHIAAWNNMLRKTAIRWMHSEWWTHRRLSTNVYTQNLNYLQLSCFHSPVAHTSLLYFSCHCDNCWVTIVHRRWQTRWQTAGTAACNMVSCREGHIRNIFIAYVMWHS